MTVTPASFKIRFPEFSAVDDAKIQIHLDDASLMLNEAFWGTKLDMGWAYLTAHYLYLSTQTEGGSQGKVLPVLSRSVDGSSVTYANLFGSANEEVSFYFLTTYGQRFLNIKKTLGTGISIV